MLKKIKNASRNFKIVSFGLILLSSAIISPIVIAHADQFDSQINSLEQQNSAAQNNVNNLQNQASSYQNEISQLQNQINGVQAALSINQNKQDSLEQQITADKANIVKQKGFLSDDIRTMYVQGQLSTLEELATSKNLSDYVDKEEYRIAVQNKIDSLITQIAQLQDQLQQQNNELQVVINTESQQSAQLASTQAQQQQLLGYNQSQQSAYNQQIQQNQSQIAVLRQEQIAANRRLVTNNGGTVDASGTCGGSYPASAISSGGHWGCDYPLDNTIDNWGMYNRECVSYTAWMVYKTYGYMPYWGGNGNANEWPGDARAAGIAVGSTPKVGSVAIYMGGSGDPFGHAMWVTAVNGSMITVQQYNLYYDGNYYQTTIDGSDLTYIYFGG